MREPISLLRAAGYQGSVIIGGGQLNQTLCDYVVADWDDTHGAGAVRFDTKRKTAPMVRTASVITTAYTWCAAVR